MKKRTSFLICLVLIMLVALSMAACHKTNVPDTPSPDDNNKTYPTVIFNFNDGTGKTQSVKMTASAKAPNVTREGYRFLGWSKSAGGTTFVENLRNLADGTQVFAIWEVKLFRVNFVVNGEVVSSDNVEYGKAATAPNPETFKDKIPAGKVFAGWDKDFDVITGVLQVNALFSDMQSYTVTFYKEKGDASPYGTPQSGTADDVIPAVKNPELAGFKFEGWFDADGNEYVEGKYFEKDATYYAKWSVAKPNAATALPLTMVYGETKTLVATPASNNVEAINYAYSWYLAGRKVADGLEIEISGLNAGTHTYTVKVTASYEGRGESSAESTVTVTVQKATLTATVSPINLVYGDDFASAEVTYSGFKGSDDESVVRGEKHFLTEYVQGADVGKYSLSVKVGEDGLWADNYDLSVVTSFITVKEKAVSASVADVRKTYDGTPLTFSGNVSSEDLPDGDELTVEFKTDSPNAGEYFYRDGESSGITVLSVKVERNGKDVSKNYKVTLTVSASIGLANVEYTPVENVETTFDGKEHFASLTLEGFNVTYSTDGENFKAAIPTFTDAGAYTVYYRIERGGYKTENNSFTVTIKKLAVLVKAKDTVVTYGNKAPTLSYEFVGETLSSELEALLKDDLLAALSTDYTQGDGVGEKTVYMAKIDSDNFDVTVQNGKIDIRPRAATVKADDKTVVYGDAATLTPTFVGLLEGDTAPQAILTCDENVSGTPVGEYEISVSATHDNYVFTFESGTLTITPREITLRVSDGTVTYGDEFDAAKQNCEIVSGEIFGSDELNVVYSSSYRVGGGAGETFEITAVCHNNNYSATVQNGTLTVTKREVSVKATAKTVVYGEAAPETYDFDVLSGSVYGTDDLGLTFAAKTYYTGASVGAYDVTGTATNGNYFVTVEKGTLTVTARKITVKAADNTAEYGSAAPSLSYSFVSGSVYGTDDLGFMAKTSYIAGDKAAEYEVTVEFSENVNYDVTVQSGTLTVTPKEITVSRTVIVAQSGNKWSLVIEGEEISGMVSGDKLYLTLKTSSAEDGEYVAKGDLSNDFEGPTLLKILRGSEDRLASYVIKYDLNVTISTKHITHDAKGYVGAYDGRAHGGTVTVEEGTLITYSTDGADYSLTTSPEFTNAGTYTVFFKLEKEGFTRTVGKFTVEIQKRTATVKANDVNVVYGDEAPEYGYSQTGILAEDLESLNITVSSAYAKGSNVGRYDVTVGFTENANYEIVTTVGKLTVDRKAVDVSPSDVTVSYGDEAAAFDIPAEYASVVRLETYYYAGANVGRYDATAIVLDDNYSVTTSSKVVCVPRKATVKAEDKTVEYGYDKPNLTCVKSGLYGSDGVEVTLSTDYAAGMAAGTSCVITISVADNGNYDFTVQNGTLTVEKRKVTVTVHSQTVVYGDDFDTSVCGFENTPLYGDDKVSVTSYSTTYNVGANAGETFEIGAETAENNNYEFIVVKGVLTVLKADLTATVTGPSAIVYGETPTFDFIVISGLKAGDVKETIGDMTYSTDYLTAPAAGTFKVNGTLNSKNYTATVSPYSMTVEKATLIVTVNPTATVTYGDPIPDFGFTAEGFKFSDNEACLTIRYETTYKKSSPVIAEGYRYNVDLDKSTAQNYTLTKGADGVLTVEKATYNASDVPSKTVRGQYSKGLTLSSITLDGGFFWKDEAELAFCTKTAYEATYNADPQNYLPFDTTVTLILEKADASASCDYAEIDWNGGNLFDSLSEVLKPNSDSGWDGASYTYQILNSPQGGNNVVDGGIYKVKVVVSETGNYNATTCETTLGVRAANVGGTLTTLERALQSAGSGSTITLASNGGVYAKVFLSAGDYTLASGATLLLSASSDSSALGSATYNSDASAPSYVDTISDYIEHILTIMTGANLTVNGNVRIQGILGRGTVGYSGGTSGKHSQLVNNGTMTFNSGSNLDAKGFVKGSGTATFKSGANVYSPFVVIDFRGGTNTVTVFNKGKISPFSQYEMPNVQCRQIYEAGAKHTGYVDLYASGKHNTDKKEVIGSSGIIQISSGYLEKTYDRSAQKATLTIVGTATLGSLTLSVSGVDAKMADVQFPIPWTYNVNIGDGTTATTLTAPYKYKVLTGANVTVAQNATLTTSEAVIVYSSFTDTAFGGSIYPSKSAANFVVNGTYNVNGSFGGEIKSTASGAKVVVSSSATLSVTSKEGNSGDTKSWQALIGLGSFTTVFTANETARFSDGTALAKGTTYTYNGSAWN